MLPRFGDSEARPPSVVMSKPATRGEIIDPQNLGLWLDIDGQGWQEGTTQTMVFGIAELVA